jgi:hypothetical protein
VLTAWKEREPSFARRRERIAAIDGSVPAFADEVELARIGDDDETDAELQEDAVAAAVAKEPQPTAVATAEPVEPERDGGGPSSNGEPPAVDPAEELKRERQERRRERRKQRRKHGRNR